MKSIRWQNCNVLAPVGDERCVWRFHRSGKKVEAAGESRYAVDALIPAATAAKTIRHLWQPRLNVAWLPATQVFLRVIQLPPCEPTELPGMVELQLEALSPLPLAQVVWSFELLPSAGEGEQTVVVILAARQAVEDYLGGLEGAGYLADRLELPQLRQLLTTPKPHDGVWIYPRREGETIACLVAWWEGEILHSLNLLALPGDETAGEHLAALLKQLAWSAEMEGWLTPRAAWRLVADAETAKVLTPPLKEFAVSGVEVREPVSTSELAKLSAVSPTSANLLPQELTARYRQQFLDGLWMRGLFALAMLYLAGVLVYFGMVQYVDFQEGRFANEAKNLKKEFDEAQRLKAKVEVLQDQVALKFAALDCFKAAAESLPEGMSLTHLTFQRGRKLGLFGTVPLDRQTDVSSYTEALMQISVNGEALFTEVSTPSIQAPLRGRGTRPATWSLECTIQREDF